MTALIDRTLPNGGSIASIVFRHLDQSGWLLNFVDVGARNGSYLLPASYAQRTRITGFEPNRVEYEKLINNRTDAQKAGMIEPAFREKKYYPYALWSEDGERTLYLTVGPGAVTLMGPADERMTKNMLRTSDRGQNFFERAQRVVGTDTVPCKTLDALWRERNERIDILKLDAEGGELEILKGAKEQLASKNILLIYTEFLLLPFYKQRVTLGHQQVLLDECGYRLIGLNLDHFPYCWRSSHIRAENDRRMQYAGDALFILDPDRNALSRQDMYRLGLACLAMGFNGVGLNFIREAGMISDADLSAIEAQANNPPLMRRIHAAWQKFPYLADRWLTSLRLRGS